MVGIIKNNRKFFEQLTCVFVITAMIGLLCSAAMISVSLALAALTSVLAGSLVKLPQAVRANPFFYALFALYLILFIGVFNNHFMPNHGWHQLKKYMGNWLLGLLILPIFADPTYRLKLYRATVYIAALGALYILAIKLMHLGHWFDKPFMAYIVNPIPWSYFLAFACFLSAQQMIAQRGLRLRYGLLLLWLFVNLFFVNIERSGMLAAVVLAVVLAWQYLSPKRTFLALLGIACVCLALFFVSPAVHERVGAAFAEAQAFFHGKDTTSIGLRMAFAQNSWHLIVQRPWFGYGTGSFAMAYHTTGGPSLSGTTYLGDPHNSYLHLWVQVGLVGLVAFIAFLTWQLLTARQLPEFERRVMQGLTWSFIVFCFCISAFLRQRAVVFYMLMLVMTCAAGMIPASPQNKTEKSPRHVNRKMSV